MIKTANTTKIAVLTAISGLTNKLVNPKKVFENVDYFAFVDNFQTESIWIQKKISDFTIDDNFKGRRNAKIYKILPELFIPGYDYYFWVDSTHELVIDPHYVINNIIKDSELALFKHPHRDCVYDEARELIKLKYDNIENIERQIDYYLANDYPINNGLYELPCSIRKNTSLINRMNLMWWEIICKYSSRDQISLPYVMYKLGIEPFIINGYANNGFNSNNIMPQIRNKLY